ncbi:hypothetical protein MJD09_13475 [bacterium]|nr:hypothetical protein [bacterium]
MQLLDPEFRQILLAHHGHFDQAVQRQPLTIEILDGFEGLVNLRSSLRQISRQNLPFRWPYGGLDSSRGAPRPALCTHPPFDRLYTIDMSKKTAKEALGVVDDAIAEVIARYMPAFGDLHAEWLGDRKATELANSNRAASTFSKSVKSDKKRMSGISTFVGATALIGLILISSITYQKNPSSIARDLVPPETAQEWQLSDFEIASLDDLYELARTRQDQELNIFIETRRPVLKDIGLTIFEQGKAWYGKRDTLKAKRSFETVAQIGILLKERSQDTELLTLVNDNPLFKEFTTWK